MAFALLRRLSIPAHERTFMLLVTDVGTIVFLPPLLTRFAREAGRLTLRAVPLDSRHFEAKLESGEADLALGAFPGAPRGLSSRSPNTGTKDVTAILATVGLGPHRSRRSRSPVPSVSKGKSSARFGG